VRQAFPGELTDERESFDKAGLIRGFSVFTLIKNQSDQVQDPV
jgi:hypothetical protein